FVLGGATLGSAMDPAGFYFADVILFFEPSPQQIVNHPGLTVTATGALAAKLACLLVGDGDSFVDFWGRHRILLNRILAALANAMLLLSCHPLFRVLRHLMDAASAYVGCAVFLSSVPVLLMVSHFADEAWMLYFTLWSIHFSFVLLDGKASASIGAAMGVCTSLAVLSKWLAAPIVALNVYSLLASRRHNAAAFWKAAGAHPDGGGALPGAVLLFRRVGLPALISGLQANWDDGRGALSFAQIFSLPYQRPLVLHHALVFGMGVLGVLAMLQAQARTRAKLVPLLATVSVIGLLTVRRPLWHYFFVLHWLFSAAAVCGLTLALRRWVGWRRD